MPDKIGVRPQDFFDEEKARSYEQSSAIQKSQIEISARVAELLELTDKKIILDIGCGTGITSKYFLDKGHIVVGVDVSCPMMGFAVRKSVDGVIADFREMPFRDESFEVVLSISTLQWVWGSSREEVIDQYAKVIKEIRRVSKPNAVIGIQFYPQTEREFNIVSEIFKKNGFSGFIVIDKKPKSKKKRKYLILTLQR
ncbi:MAG: class I SAM-dependent methyltransferase [Candidatus Odinarchaeia archaeon]